MYYSNIPYGYDSEGNFDPNHYPTEDEIYQQTKEIEDELYGEDRD